MFDRLALIGAGMIGGSFALALRQAGACREIVAYDIDPRDLRKAHKRGTVDLAADSPCEAVRDAQLVMLAIPVGAVEKTCRALRQCLPEAAILTDVGSVKGGVIEAVARGLGRLPPRFVPAHPIAGKERSGIEAASGDLFLGRRVIVTPHAGTRVEALTMVKRLWEMVGAVVEEMGVEHHDEVLAATSHLPHLLAFALVDSLSRLGESEDIFRYAAGGFRDFTRIASSDPVMWRDVCLGNRDAILQVLHHFEHDLQELTRAVAEGDASYLHEMFSRAKRARDRFSH